MANIAKNTAFMTMASIGQKIVAFVYFTLIARNIGVDGTGRYFFALSFTTILVVFVDLGLTNVLVREASKFKDKVQLFLSTVLSVKILLGIVSYLAAVLVIKWLGYPLETRQLVYLSSVTMLFDSLHLTIYGVLRSIGELKYEAIGIVGSQLLTLVLGSIFLFLGYPLIFLILAFTIPSFVNVLFVTVVISKKHGLRVWPSYDAQVLKYFLKIAAPFAIAAVLSRLYSYADTMILSKLAGDTAVGHYSIAYKITFAFQFVPLALVAALYPRFSEFFSINKERLSHVFAQAVMYLLIVAFPISVGIGVLAPDIILSLYTAEYMDSILPLQILLVGLVFSYVSFPIGAFLNACNRQTTQTVIVAIILFVNIVLNLILIPRFAVVGAAIAAAAGNILLAVLGYLVVHRVVHINHSFLAKNFLAVAFCSFIMAIFVWYVNFLSHFTLAILVGGVVYPVMLFATRTLSKRQLIEAVRLVKN